MSKFREAVGYEEAEAERPPDQTPEPESGADGGKEILLYAQPTEEDRKVFDILNKSAGSLTEFADCPPDPNATLLGNRYLCRQSGMLFVGSSGMGKSSALVQAAILWSLGRLAFGIQPNGPLSSVLIQAENDAGDMHEMAEGVMRSLELTAEDRAQVHERTWTRRESCMMGRLFLDKVLAPIVAVRRPDLVILDPLLCYCGCDPVDTAGILDFLQHGLNPILFRYNAGGLISHHTPKTNYRDTSKWTPSDWMYAGMGGSATTNWARAVLAAESCGSGVYRFRAAKRGPRIGWRDPEDGEWQEERLFRHSRAGAIFWEPATDQDLREAQTDGLPERAAEHILHCVPAGKTVRYRDLTEGLAQQSSPVLGRLTVRHARLVTNQLVEQGVLAEQTGPKGVRLIDRGEVSLL